MSLQDYNDSLASLLYIIIDFVTLNVMTKLKAFSLRRILELIEALLKIHLVSFFLGEAFSQSSMSMHGISRREPGLNLDP